MPSKKCANGTICINKSGIFITLVVIFLIAVIYVIYNDNVQTHHRRRIYPEHVREERPLEINVAVGGGGDSRYSQAPQPLRDWRSHPELPPLGAIADIPFGIATKGFPEKYQSMGVITTDGGDTLPLYGRRTIMGGDRWNYYTRTDTYNPVQLPLHIGRRDCTEDVGCDEVSNGDMIKIPVKGQSGKITLYNNSGPRYYPGLL